jgi:surfeit locus 1 family protein
MRAAAFLIIVGLGGAAILLSLGVWQVQRLAWKQGVIADIDARIGAEPVALPDTPEPLRDNYLPVNVAGFVSKQYLRVLVSDKVKGAGYRVIFPMRTDNPAKKETILLDLGFVPAATNFAELEEFRFHGIKTVTGNLQWPDEVDGFTPEPDVAKNIWYARDVPAMAQALNTAPVLLVVRESTPTIWYRATPLPVDVARIPNNHLQYAITWFSLAALWLAMSIYFIRRRRTASEG